MENKEKKLEVKNLQVSFRTQGGNVKAVRDISFDLYKGETLAIVGESGSGKSVTSKAIIGILAPNSIVEGGEILYDGQDLLKISEDDFHKIRGDKISMIFQDPLSSLNPIVRVGKQLTEAMILKSKSSQRNARNDFNGKLELLNKNLDLLAQSEEEKANNKKQCKEFDNFCIESTILEQDYNTAVEAAIDLVVTIDDLLFLTEKKQKVDYKKQVKLILKTLARATHPYVVVEDEKLLELINSLTENASIRKQGFSKENFALAFDKVKQGFKSKEIDVEKLISDLKEIKAIVEKAQEKEKPNFFRLGYYIYKNPTEVENCEKMDVNKLNDMTRKYLDDNFMLAFIELGEKGLQKAFDVSIEAKKNTLVKANDALTFFSKPELDKKEAITFAKDLAKDVEASINRLDIVKKSVEYSFRDSIFDALNRYFSGVKRNPINQRKYEKRMAKYQKLVDANKKPTWQVTPPVLVDLDLTKENICKIIKHLIDFYNDEIAKANTFNKSEKMVELIDHLKDQASKVVYKVTQKMAKAKALKLLEEVGISEPQIRYNQFPFEFSGGMRQRIVIAIALSANPDILICDEPTTALDVTIQSQILELINRIKEERKLSVIFITHDLGVVANMADRIAVMYAGKIVEYGTSEDIFYDPRHPYTWALLSSMPDLETKEKLEAIPGTPPNMIYPPKGDAFAERNKYALEIDYEMQPPLFEVSKTHYAATWLLHPNAPKVEMPKIVTERIKRMKEALDNESRK